MGDFILHFEVYKGTYHKRETTVTLSSFKYNFWRNNFVSNFYC